MPVDVSKAQREKLSPSAGALPFAGRPPPS